MTSQIKTFLLLALLSGLIIVLGAGLGGQVGLFFAFAFALLLNVFTYWYSDKIVLKMYKAREVNIVDAPILYKIVSELANKAAIPMPRVYIIPQDSPNAFATGRNPEHGVVAVTQGILNLLSADELRGVVAHELGHIKNRDILVQTVASVLGTVVVSLANFLQWGAIFGGRGRSQDGGGGMGLIASLLLAFLAPLAAALIQFAVSRSREYLADAAGADISGKPLALAGALYKLDNYAKQIPMQATPATESMFIVSPLSGGKSFSSLFSTHPPTEERIRRLQNIAAKMSGQKLV